jgi:hypothetical protein
VLAVVAVTVVVVDVVDVVVDVGPSTVEVVEVVRAAVVEVVVAAVVVVDDLQEAKTIEAMITREIDTKRALFFTFSSFFYLRLPDYSLFSLRIICDNSSRIKLQAIVALNIRFVNRHYVNICPHLNIGDQSNYS